MEYYLISDARKMAEGKLDKDRGRIVGLIGLRLAQIKHVLLQLQKLDEVQAHPERVARLKEMMPPNSDDWVLEYSLNTHDFFLKKIAPLLMRSENLEVRKWTSELETTLEDIHRLVVQNLSKHPAMKPYRILGVLEDEWTYFQTIQDEFHTLAREHASLKSELENIREEKDRLRGDPSFQTLVRLEESRRQLVEEKRALMDQWSSGWSRVEPVLTRLLERSKTFEHMENSQLRTLQLYLANPVTARMKDPHGSGFLMILRLAVEAMEEKRVFHAEEREDARAALLDTIQNSAFTEFFEHTHRIDLTLEANIREFSTHPLYQRLLQVENEENRILNRLGELDSHQETIRLRQDEKKKEVDRLVKEADWVCQSALGVGVKLPSDYSPII